jgi:predicted phage-related endonuclease
MLNERQRQERKGGIGGSLTPAILGLDRYTTPLQAYLFLRGELPAEDATSEAAEFGTEMESGILRITERRLQATIAPDIKAIQPHQTAQSKEHPWLLGNFDALLRKYPAGVEIKNRDRFMRQKYGEPWTDSVMDTDMIQCQHYMLVSGLREWFLSAAFGGNTLAIFHLRAHEELQRMIVAKTAEFMEMVRNGTPPPPMTNDDLGTLYARDSGALRLATLEEEGDLRYLRSLKKEIKELEETKAHWEFNLKARIGDLSGLIDDDGRPLVTWKKAKDSRVFDMDRFKAENPVLAAQYMTVRPGSRRFLVKGAGDDD